MSTKWIVARSVTLTYNHMSFDRKRNIECKKIRVDFLIANLKPFDVSFHEICTDSECYIAWRTFYERNYIQTVQSINRLKNDYHTKIDNKTALSLISLTLHPHRASTRSWTHHDRYSWNHPCQTFKLELFHNCN